MGGFLIIGSVLVATLLCADWHSSYVWLALAALTSFGFLGFLDDYLKIKRRTTDGLSARQKLAWQLIFGFTLSCVLYSLRTSSVDTTLIFPIFKRWQLDLGALFPWWCCLVIVASSNAANLTDGLDGLVTMPVVIIASALGVFVYSGSHHEFARYLLVPYVSRASELAIVCSSLAGAGLGFLWFNSYPAQIFMGDVGSLGLGAALGIIAVMVRQELAYLIMAGVLVAETLSVIIQLTSLKFFHRRVFKMAPLHHHFEIMGWSEPKIIVRFWIVTVILALVGLATLKIR